MGARRRRKFFPLREVPIRKGEQLKGIAACPSSDPLVCVSFFSVLAAPFGLKLQILSKRNINLPLSLKITVPTNLSFSKKLGLR